MDWKLIFQGITSLGVFASFIGALVAVRKYYYEKNRDIYIRRLNEVYAPLFGMVVKQEEFRQSFMNDYPFTKAPLISLNTVKKISKQGYSREEVPGIIHRDKFNDCFNNIEKGLARPQLLELINKYQILDHILIEKKYNVERKDELEEKLVDIEAQLILEIVNGYYETIDKLEIDKHYKKIYLANI
jgi:hypothetical protein